MMKLKTTLVSVNRGDVFAWTRSSTYGKRALFIVDNDISEVGNVHFASFSGASWAGGLPWLSDRLEAGDIIYLGTVDNIKL